MEKTCCSCHNESTNCLSGSNQIFTVKSTKWSIRDYCEAGLVRVSNRFRMQYKTEPGLYSVNNARVDSPVFVTANYRSSFNIVRRALKGISAWILVLDTQGINVWCAAGKKTMSTQELVQRIQKVRLAETINHKQVIVPQLAAPGINCHDVFKQSGFRVIFGPIHARDIPEFIQNSYQATVAMRTIEFTFIDRIKLIPIELEAALPVIVLLVVLFIILGGITQAGYSFAQMIPQSKLFIISLLVAAGCGIVITPMILPWIPFRAFSLKGVVIGLLVSVPFVVSVESILLKIFFCLFIPLLSSYWAFNFTGATTFTNPSGVKKELIKALPMYLITALCCSLLLILYHFNRWR